VTTLATVLVAAILVGAALTTRAQHMNEDERAIRRVLADFVAAVNRHDVTAFGHLLAEDAEFVVITGQYLRGWNEIQRYHAGIWQDAVFGTTQLTWHPVHVRFLRPDVAVAHVAAVRTDQDNTALRHMFLTVVVAKQDNQWVIAALQNTLTRGAAGSPHLSASDAGKRCQAFLALSWSHPELSDDFLSVQWVRLHATR
jgi:uncharacterized protein (TIGR02246 family)